ncbi:MAG: RDD family protein, partial [Deltaproteobacteria bacterium]|nr:RDD family protein [Deltaproteobacteria bacterium]
HQRPIFSFLLFTALPIFYFLWHTVWETFLQTTLGLWVFGCKIVTEEGAPIGFTHSFLRSLFRLFDTNPFGWAILFLSRKNQRPSDLAGGTVVVHAKRAFSALLGAGISLGLIGGIWLWGLTYPNNYLTPFFRFDLIAGKITQEILAGTSRRPVTQNIQGRKLLLKDFHYMNQDRSTERQSSIFKPGERIFFSFSLSGFTVRDSQVWIQEDLTVRYPDNSIGFKQENIVEFRQHLKDPEQPVEIVNTLILPAEAQAGNYTLILQLRDRLSNRQLTEQRTFRVVR